MGVLPSSGNEVSTVTQLRRVGGFLPSSGNEVSTVTQLRRVGWIYGLNYSTTRRNRVTVLTSLPQGWIFIATRMDFSKTLLDRLRHTEEASNGGENSSGLVCVAD
jgi:hypothetical protein